MPEGTEHKPLPDDPVVLVYGAYRASIVVEREPAFFDFDVIETTCPACDPEPK